MASQLHERSGSKPVGRTIILQRGVSHYRRSLFEALFDRFGWVVAATVARGRADGYSEVTAAPFLVPIAGRLVWWWPRVLDLSLSHVLGQLRPEMVIAEFSMYLTSTYKLALRRRLRGRPRLVFHTHGFNMERRHDRLRDRAMDWVRRQVIGCADAIACYSEEGRAHLARHLPAEKLFVTRNTIDVAPMRALRGVEPLRRGQGPHLLAVGRMTRDKRMPELVGVFRAVLADFPTAQLTLVGDGPDMPSVRAAAGELVGRSVHLPGLVYAEADLAPLFMAADLCVIAGAAGLAVNHALAYGLPVVAFRRTDRGPFHHPEICYVVEGVTGWLAEPFADRALAARITEVLRAHPSPRAALGQAIDAYVDANLTLDHLVADFHAVYRYAARSDSAVP